MAGSGTSTESDSNEHEGGEWTRLRKLAGFGENLDPVQQEEQAVERVEDGGGGSGAVEEDDKEEVLEGIASIALFPSGSLSGHFLHTASSTCLGLFGTEIACERECSRGEDYRLLNLTIINFKTKKETTVVVERKGEDAARLSTTCDLHGWDEEVVQEANNRHRSGGTAPVITFECETLKAGREAEEHLKKFLPSLVGRDAAVNIGRMTIKSLSLSVKDTANGNLVQPQSLRVPPKRTLEDALRLVFGEADVEIADSAQKRQVVSAESPSSAEGLEIPSLIKAIPIHRAPCDFDDDF